MGERRPPILSVGQVALHLQSLLEQDPLLADLWVNGEVSNLRVSQKGHFYFTLKDSEGVLECLMFRGAEGRRGGSLLQDGNSVLAHGRVTFYPARGKVSLIVDLVVPEGTGALHLELERLKLRLEEEGLFDESRKRPLPRFPRTVAVVTSPTGAVIQDIHRIISRRFPLTRIVLVPTPVQGEGAEHLIAEAIKVANSETEAEVLIVARGGGSLEDLAPFNTEVVARAIYASKMPVVSAVGHETDVTIADLVADQRAPTPSAAAEMVVPDRRELAESLASMTERMAQALVSRLRQHSQAVHSASLRLDAHAPRVETLRPQVDRLAGALSFALRSRVDVASHRTRALADKLGALAPQGVLRRGFALVSKDGGTPVSSTAQVRPGDPLTITVSDGSFPATTGNGSRTRRTHPAPGASERLL